MDCRKPFQLHAFCVIVPMYNEERGAEVCVHRICAALASIAYPSALIVVNDGSSDETGVILERLHSQFPALTVIHHNKNSGYGAALRTGIRKAAEAGFDYALFMDSDLTNDPEDIPKFIERMRNGYDVIKATRYSAGGAVRGVPRYRVAISRFGNRIARRLYRVPIADCTNGFRAIRLKLLHQIQLTERNFSIIMEELYHCKFLACSFAEVPVTLTNRCPGQRRTSFTYRPQMFYDYLKYPLKAFLGVIPSKEKQ